MKRATIGIGVAVVLAAVVGGLAPWTLSGRHIRVQISRQIRKATGLTMEPPTRITFAVLPHPLIKLENVRIHDSRGALSVRSPVVKGNLNLISLAEGRIELSSMTFFGPTVRVDIDKRPMLRKGAIARASRLSASSPRAAAVDSSALAVIRILSGTLDVVKPSRNFATTITNVDGKLDWRRLDSPASLSVNGDWRGHSGELMAWIDAPAALLRGAASQLTLHFRSSVCNVKFDGSAKSGPAWRLTGRASASAPSLLELSEWLQDGALMPSALGGAQFSAQANADPKAVAFDALRLTLAGSQFDGSAALRLDSLRPLMSATLATDDLAITPYLSEFPRLIDDNGAWSKTPLANNLGPLDLDLRISASKAKLARVEFSHLGMAVLLENNRLRVDVVEAEAYGGALKGRMVIAPQAGTTDVRMSGSFANVDSASVLWAAAAFDKLNGSATGRFSASGRGDSVAQLIERMTGEAQFRVANGEFMGVDLERALRRIDTRPLSVAEEVHGGSTSFASFSGDLAVGGGKASLQNVVLSGPGAEATLAGDALLADQSLDLSALAQQAGPDGKPSAKGAHLKLRFRGSWTDPRLVLNAASLVRRSEAAAPLFDMDGASRSSIP